MKKIVLIYFFSIASTFCYSQNTKSVDSCYVVGKTDTTWQTTCVQVAPSFPGGGDQALYKFLAKETRYPQFAKENNIQGRVYITYVIDKTGEVTMVEVQKGAAIDEKNPIMSLPDSLREKEIAIFNKGAIELADEAIRVVKAMPKWNPGSQDGKLVRVRYILPFRFKLQ